MMSCEIELQLVAKRTRKSRRKTSYYESIGKRNRENISENRFKTGEKEEKCTYMIFVSQRNFARVSLKQK